MLASLHSYVNQLSQNAAGAKSEKDRRAALADPNSKESRAVRRGEGRLCSRVLGAHCVFYAPRALCLCCRLVVLTLKRDTAPRNAKLRRRPASAS